MVFSRLPPSRPPVSFPRRAEAAAVGGRGRGTGGRVRSGSGRAGDEVSPEGDGGGGEREAHTDNPPLAPLDIDALLERWRVASGLLWGYRAVEGGDPVEVLLEREGPQEWGGEGDEL
jgi:hypothetical protein